jgi:outer membrane lipoprotein-sorting protein
MGLFVDSLLRPDVYRDFGGRALKYSLVAPLLALALLVLGMVFLSPSVTIAADLPAEALRSSKSGGGAKAGLTLDDIIINIQANQSAIKDMSADTVTTITSTMKGAKTMTQKGKILMKYPDKSRVEMFEPAHQITINNGEKMILINKDTGQRYEQDLSRGVDNAAQGQFNLEKAKKQFDFSVKRDGDNYVIIGLPKDGNKLLGKMEMYIDPVLWLTKKVKIFTPQGKLMSQSEIEYSEAPSIARSEGVWVMTKTTSNVSMPMGSMKMEMKYENIKVNQGIKDREFEVE